MFSLVSRKKKQQPSFEFLLVMGFLYTLGESVNLQLITKGIESRLGTYYLSVKL